MVLQCSWRRDNSCRRLSDAAEVCCGSWRRVDCCRRLSDAAELMLVALGGVSTAVGGCRTLQRLVVALGGVSDAAEASWCETTACRRLSTLTTGAPVAPVAWRRPVGGCRRDARWCFVWRLSEEETRRKGCFSTAGRRGSMLLLLWWR
jgi:hypothetical protein